MKQVEITIIRAELMNFFNKDTKERHEMTKITYCVELSNTDRVVGYSILECFKQGNILNKLQPYIMKKVVSYITETGTNNGTKWSIAKIDNKDL